MLLGTRSLIPPTPLAQLQCSSSQSQTEVSFLEQTHCSGVVTDRWNQALDKNHKIKHQSPIINPHHSHSTATTSLFVPRPSRRCSHPHQNTRQSNLTAMNTWKLGTKSTCGNPYPCRTTVAHYPPESKDSKETGVVSRSITPVPPSRAQTPRPPGGENIARSGMLTIRIFSGTSSSPHGNYGHKWLRIPHGV